MSELSIFELEAETGEVLPARETLGTVNGSYNHIFAFNQAIALQGYTHDSTNVGVSVQHISVG